MPFRQFIHNFRQLVAYNLFFSAKALYIQNICCTFVLKLKNEW